MKTLFVCLKEMFTSFGMRNLPFRILKPVSKKYKFLDLILSQFHPRSYGTFTNGFDTSIFDSVQVQKYLNFITNEGTKQSSQLNIGHKISELLKRKENLEKEIIDLKNMSNEKDDELKKLIELEKAELLENIEQIKNEILINISIENEEERDIELQIYSGIGGEEAKLFRMELFQMYINYAEFKNWECVEDLNAGYLLISGESVYGHLRYEGGVHRVQRVPETEKQNRIHTSTCSVVILPQPKPHEIEINERDLIIEKMRSSGPGGQNVNKTESCIRIKHIPTDIVVENQTSRFQYENKKIAIQRLKSILFNIEQNKVQQDRKNLIKGQAGTNDYADKIRTYNFHQNRITDHRLNHSMYNIKSFLSGTRDLDCMINKLKDSQKKYDLLYRIEKTLQSAEYKNYVKNQGL